MPTDSKAITMTKTKILRAVFDGRVPSPEESVDLELGGHYVLTVESEQDGTDIEIGPAFNLSSLAAKNEYL